jgi:LuxR family maltose regulon positive regulatory protein
MQQSRQFAEKTGSTQLDDYLVDLSQARLWFDQGDLESAFKWLEERGLDRLPDEEKMNDPGAASALPYDLRAGEQVMAVRIYIAQNRLIEALDLAQPLLLSAEQQNRVRRVIEISNLQALAHQGRGEIEEALSVLGRSLRLAEPGDHVRIFVDEGQAMARLLHEAASQGIHADYCGRLLAAFKKAEPIQAPTGAEFHPPEMIEPLSARELEILLLIAEGLSNRAIADRLSITISTVKGHASNIYGKLAVTRRTEAIARGRTLGLIP